jgi:hypothetical protein
LAVGSEPKASISEMKEGSLIRRRRLAPSSNLSPAGGASVSIRNEYQQPELNAGRARWMPEIQTAGCPDTAEAGRINL